LSYIKTKKKSLSYIRNNFRRISSSPSLSLFYKVNNHFEKRIYSISSTLKLHYFCFSKTSY